MKKKGIVTIIIILFIATIGIFASFDAIRYFMAKDIPADAQYTSIKEPRIDGELGLYYDNHHGRYWLFYIKSNRKKLVMYAGGVKGYVSVKAVGANKVEVYYDYLQDVDYPREDKRIIIDLSKNQTINVSVIRKLME
ncbi:hypothetical protein DFR58_13632 [Anaerobacterium chartisolvens]|uniref:Uncharacterized protein n=1 Tax=Anaerobacterium chartisolvens TaxID=1297424 RepID=A0A369AM50_9FIRM|nr:hypothetical protein [Anaerobacterium chartisolvens]RCX09356.1 hypothetical protein DFR58_13632 [Anaerobacterium chartisolvens]